ncbi:MAG: hypothetical protein R6V46_13210 [Desulfatiglandaceae bacterium]
MVEELKNHSMEKVKKQKKTKKEDLPFCTSAPSAEHARGMEFEEPCDDARTGDYAEENSEN